MRLALLTLTMLVAASACASPTQPTPTASPTTAAPSTAAAAPVTDPLAALTTQPPAPAFTTPTYDPPDSGVAFVTPVAGARLENEFETRAAVFRSLVDDGSFAFSDTGVDIEVETCEVVAPHQWLISGTAVVPDGNPLALAGLRFESFNPDLFDTAGWYPNTSERFIVELTRSGRFTLHHDRAAVQRDVPPGRFPMFDVGPVCSVEVAWSLAPLAAPLTQEVERTISSEPVVWEAPEGSVQAVGIGAVLSDPTDTRSTWAYATWNDWALPFPLIAVASVPGVWSAGQALPERDGNCVWVDTTYRHINQVSLGRLIQAQGCDRLSLMGELVTGGHVDSAPGWDYLTPAGPEDDLGGEEPLRYAATSVGGFDLYVVLPAGEAVFVEFLNSFAWLENLVIG